MKIVFLNLYSGLVNRGAERSISELASRLIKNHQVVVIQGKKHKEKYAVKEIKTDVNLKNPDVSLNLLRRAYLDYWSRKILIFTLKAVPYLWRERFDIVIPTNGGWQSLICRLITWIQGKKLVIIGRAGIGWDDRINLLTRPDAFVVLSLANLSWAKKHSLGIKIVQIPNGVDMNKFYSHKAKIRLALKPPIVLVVSAIIPSKRLDLLIEAIAKLKDVSLLIVGKGSGRYRMQIEQLAKEKLAGRYVITQASFAAMPDYYRLANVFTLPVVISEAFGNVFLEAMATNLPVVTSDDPTRRYIVGNAGLFVDPEDTDAYAKAISRALKMDFSDKPLKQAKNFSWERVVAEYEKLFQNL